MREERGNFESLKDRLSWRGYYSVPLKDRVDHIYYFHVGSLWVYWIRRKK